MKAIQGSNEDQYALMSNYYDELLRSHALVCIESRKYDVYKYMHNYYLKETYIRSYAHAIKPNNEPTRWLNPRQNPMVPPEVKKKTKETQERKEKGG